MHTRLLNHGIARYEEYLEDDFLEPDSEKCVEYYYEKYIVEREELCCEVEMHLEFNENYLDDNLLI